MNPLRAIIFASPILLLLAACTSEPNVYNGKGGSFGYTWTEELQMGRESDASIVKEMGLYPDEDLAGFVSSLGHELLAKSAMMQPDAPELYRNTEFTFRLLDSPVVNAFALPGGYVYVTRGLLAHVNNDAQLAVVIGHEITHVEARHASKQALKQQWGNIGLMAGSILTQSVIEDEALADSLLDLSGKLVQLTTLKYGRDAERESDLHGVEYAAKCGYDAAQGAPFFRSLKRISEKSGQRIPAWMSSHPDPGEREETIKKLSTKWIKPGANPIVGTDPYMERIRNLIVGQNPRDGFEREGVFYHPNLNLQFALPPGWTLDNQPEAVILMGPGRVATQTFSIAKESSPLDAAKALIARTGLTLSSSDDARIDGMPALEVSGVIETSNGALPIAATYVERDGKVFSFLGYSSPAVFADARTVMLEVARSLTQIENPSYRDIQPARIQIVTAEREAPFQTFLPTRLAPGTDALDWAIMNQVELDETIPKGRLLKLPNSFESN